MTIVNEHDIEELRFSLKNRLGEALLLTSQEDMLRYCRDWHGDVTSSAVAVIRPRSTKEVSDAVRACAEPRSRHHPSGRQYRTGARRHSR